MLKFLENLLNLLFKKQSTQTNIINPIKEQPKQEVKSFIPIYKQSDSKWGYLTIGKSKLTLTKDGCYICSLAMLDGRTPDIILGILNRNNAFRSDGALLNDIAAKLLNRTYKYSTNNPNKICICETNHFKNEGYPQHFFVWLNDGNKINDPLDGKIKNNIYNVVSYRLFDKIS
jgi:hypothetical protein